MEPAAAAAAAPGPPPPPPSRTLRIVSWNVGQSGLARTVERVSPDGTLGGLLRELRADILCLQEVKNVRADLRERHVLADGYASYVSLNRSRTVYAGCATVVSDSCPVDGWAEGVTGALAAVPGCAGDDLAGGSSGGAAAAGVAAGVTTAPAPDDAAVTPLELDSEGRTVITDHGGFVLINTYCPAVTSDDEEAAARRRAFKRQFHDALAARVRALHAAGRAVVVVGDLNVSHTRLDHCDPDEWVRTHGGRPFEATDSRRWMTEVTTPDPVLAAAAAGGLRAPRFPTHLVDAFRVFHAGREGAFTCWNKASSARANNYGTRLDYVLVSRSLVDPAPPPAGPGALRLTASDIQQDVQGSDHCPVWGGLTVTLAPAGSGGDGSSGWPWAGTYSSKRPHPVSANAWPELAKRQASLTAFFGRAAAAATAPAAAPPGPLPEGDADGYASAGGREGSAAPPPKRTRLGDGGGAASGISGRAAGGGTRGRAAATPSLMAMGFVVPQVRGASGGGASAAALAASSDGLRRPGGVAGSGGDGAVIDLLSDSSSSADDDDDDAPARGGTAAAPAAAAGAAAPSAAATASASWAAMLKGPPPPPLCRCGLPAVQREQKKPGERQGARFWVCTKPEGRKGDPNARCDFFRWHDAYLRSLRGGEGGGSAPGK